MALLRSLQFAVLILFLTLHVVNADVTTFDLLDLITSEKNDFTVTSVTVPSPEPSAEPTTEPSAEPTALPTPSPTHTPTLALNRPSAPPVANPEYISYNVDLRLTNATSNVLDSAAVSILQNSVANASQVRPSEVTLLSYTASAARLSESDALAHTAESQNENPFLPVLRRLFSEQNSVDDNHRSIRMNTLATNSYTIRAICAIRVALADYPQFNGNITALYTTLTNNLLQAVSDNSLVNTIRILSVQANSVTFQFINGVEVLEITLPLAEGFPTAMPTIAPDDDISGPDYSTGEIAGMIIAVMVLLALFVIGMYYLITYRKPDRSEVYLYVEPTQMDTLMNSPARSVNVTERNEQRSVQYDNDVVDL